MLSSIYASKVHSKAAIVLLAALVAASLSAAFGVTVAQANRALITRGDLVKKVSNAAGFHEDPGPQIFQDVPPTHEFYRYVNRMANRGAVGGFSCGTVPAEPCVAPNNLPYFRPDVNATRGQAAKIVAVAAGFTDSPTGQTFQDIPPGSTFYVWVQQLADRGIVEGFACGARPQDPCIAPENRPYYRPFEPIAKQDAQTMVRMTFHNDGE